MPRESLFRGRQTPPLPFFGVTKELYVDADCAIQFGDSMKMGCFRGVIQSLDGSLRCIFLPHSLLESAGQTWRPDLIDHRNNIFGICYFSPTCSAKFNTIWFALLFVLVMNCTLSFNLRFDDIIDQNEVSSQSHTYYLDGVDPDFLWRPS
jgi:hypothetical protein